MAESNIESPEPYENGVLCFKFTENQERFICGMKEGYRIYSSDPLMQKICHPLEGGILHVEILPLGSFVVFVGDGSNYDFPSNKVVIWDLMKRTFIWNNRYQDRIRGVKLKADRMAIILETVIYVYKLSPLPQFIHEYQFVPNPKGLCAICPNDDNYLLACPSINTGIIEIVNLYSMERHKTIPAHDNPIRCIAFNFDGTRLATASEKGTLIRVFNPYTGNKVNELRRGASDAEIYCISFSRDSTMMCVSSDHGTIHVFYVEAKNNYKNTQTSLYGAKLLSSYFSSTWSFCKMEIPALPCICSFCGKHIIVICPDGNYFKFSYTPEEKYHLVLRLNFLTLPEARMIECGKTDFEESGYTSSVGKYSQQETEATPVGSLFDRRRSQNL